MGLAAQRRGVWHHRGVSRRVEIRQSTDLRSFFVAVEKAFGDELREDRLPELERIIERDRLLAALEDETIVGGAAAFSFRLTVPGGEVDAAGVTAVGVLPTHRRRGILTQLMRRQLDDVRDRGEPVAILWATEGGIYQRFGYGLASLGARVEIERARTSFRRTDAPEGRVRLIEPDEAARSLPSLYDAVRLVTPGFNTRSREVWAIDLVGDPEGKRHGFGPKRFAILEVAGRPEGYAIYRMKMEWDWRGPRGELQVRELIATTPRALREMSQYLFSIDLVTTISAPFLHVDHPLLLLLAEPRRLNMTLYDALWLRIVDLPAALAARSYRGSGEFVVEAADAFMPANAGRWLVRVDAGRASVDRTARAPDLGADITDLGAAYLGAFSFHDLERAGRVSEHLPGAVRRIDDLVRTDVRPWSPFVF